MHIKCTYWMKPGPSRKFDWVCIDADTYDGAEDSKTNHQVGFGETKHEAICDLVAILKQDALENKQ